MKKSLLLLACAALLLAGCSKEQAGVVLKEGGLQDVTFTAKLESGVTTKAAADGDGAAQSVNRCIMEIYYGGELFARQYAPVDGEKKASFTAQMVSNRTYKVAFWADCVDDASDEAGLATDKYYTTSSLKEIALNGTYAGNDDARDAFFVCEEFTVEQTGSAFVATLRRPFAQMNVITTDWDKVTIVETLKPEKVNVTLKNAMVAFNALTGEASGSQNLMYETAVYTSAANGAEKTLSMDYLFASGEKSVIDIDWKAVHGTDTDVAHAFAAVPFQRNYRTNVKGKLLTTQGQWTVTVDPIWTGNGSGDDDPWLVNYVEAGSIAAANEALKTSNSVSIENPSDMGTDIVIPAEQDGNDVYIKITGASAGDIVIKKAAGGPANLNVESDSKTLDIDLPNSHVNVNKGNYTAVTAKTSATTLVLGKDVKVGTLTINGGNARIYGLVDAINKQASTVVDFYVSTAAGLRSVADKISAAPANKDFYGKVYLTADIDLDNEEWTPIAAFQKPLTIEGNGYTVKNLKVSESAAAYIGFIGSACGLTVKNLNFDTVTLSYPSAVGENARGGVIVGQVYGATIENCSVKNVEIVACQKVGGLLGYIEGNTNVPHSIKNCSVENVSIKSNDPAKILQHGAGGFIGHISLSNNPLVLISGCSVKDVTIADFGTAEYSSSEMQRIPHVFIGNACNNHTGAEVADITSHSIVLENNTISGTNTVLPACMYSSEYFGWAGNAEERPAWKGGIYIDGQAWAPNYPVKNVTTGKGYATLAAAITALQEGETIEILQAGEYTVQTLSAPANTTIEATVDGVVFNRTPGGSITSYGTANPVTVKNITWNIGSSNYQYFNCKAENCTINGRISGHTFVSLKNCNLINTYAEDYCVTTYASTCTFENCTFSSQGKFVNVYGESTTTPTEVSAVNCRFVNLKSSLKKAAFNIKGNGDGQKQHAHVVIDNCETEGLFPDHTTTDGSAIFFDGGLIMFDDPAWEDDVYAVVDGITYYPYFSMDASGNYSVNNAAGLKKAIKHWNALKVSGEKSITLADGTYDASDMAIFQNYAGKSLLIKAENEKQAVVVPTAGSKQLIFVVAGMSKTYAGNITIDGIKFDMSGASRNDIESDVISISDAVGTNLPADEKALYSGTYHYGHDITVRNCEIIGLGINNKFSSVVRTENQNAYNVKVQNCVIDRIGYVLTSKITTLAEVSGCTITNSKCVINSTVDGTEYKVFGNTISSYNDYCIRVNFGPIAVENNTFNMTWTPQTGEASDAPAPIVLRGSTGNEAKIAGNTFNKASGAMYDLYCTTSWNVNGETIPAGTGKNL